LGDFLYLPGKISVRGPDCANQLSSITTPFYKFANVIQHCSDLCMQLLHRKLLLQKLINI